jgi:hypothetical protein
MSIFPYFFVLVFILIIGKLIFNAVGYMKNSSAPRQSSFVKIVAKRTRVDRHNNPAPGNVGHSHSHSHTYYYITLEYENGERKEFLDVKKLYGLVAEGDVGYAATQGDWIVNFERVTAPSLN